MTTEKKKLILYLAGPSGFTELGRFGVKPLKEILLNYYDVVDPFEIAAEKGKKITEFEKLLSNTHTGLAVEEIRRKLRNLNTEIGEENTSLIQKADIIFAILDGVDVDSGTASEIGYAFGSNKKILGFRSDFRITGDNFGSEVNIQVEYFIRASGGVIFHSIEEVEKQLPFQAKANKVNR
jgi:nucleoside 2-deoxyribosyltransferase